MSRVTLASLARELGVSHQTVSNVINAPHKVRPQTRERIEAAIAASGYRPSSAGRALRSQRSRRLGFRLAPAPDGITGVVMDRFLHSCVREVERAGRMLTVFSPASAGAEIAGFVEAYRRSELDGVLLTDTRPGDPRPAALAEAGVPFVTFGRPWTGSGTHPWVDVDGARGTAAAAVHLASLGHERIGYVGWVRGAGTGRDREEGFRRALGDAIDEDLVDRTGDRAAAGSAAARELAARGATALVCASDALALGAQDVLSGAVTGFDDTPVAAVLGLTSLAQPVERAARLLVDALVGLIEGDQRPLATLLPPALHVRTPRVS